MQPAPDGVWPSFDGITTKNYGRSPQNIIVSETAMWPSNQHDPDM